MTYRKGLDTARVGARRWLWLTALTLPLACSESSAGANADAATPDADAPILGDPLLHRLERNVSHRHGLGRLKENAPAAHLNQHHRVLGSLQAQGSTNFRRQGDCSAF